MSVILSIDDCNRLLPMLESAIREVRAALEPDAMVQPDTVEGGQHLLESLDWAFDLLARIYFEYGIRSEVLDE